MRSTYPVCVFAADKTKIIKYCISTVCNRAVVAFYVRRRMVFIEHMMLDTFHLALI